MRLRGGWWLSQAGIALSVAGGVWLGATAVRGGWDAADPVASVLGGAAGVVALVVSLRSGAGVGSVTGGPPPPPALTVPAWVVDRQEAEQVVAAVCGRGRTSAVGITTGLHGAGGFGKTTLAQVVCAHPRVRRRFRGRVYFVTVGRNIRGRAAIAAKVVEATRFITGDSLDTGQDPDQAGAHLGRLLARRPRTLLVIDDVWEPEQLEPFLHGAQGQCVRLVTTRRPTVLPPEATRIMVDRMSPEQAHAVLSYNLAGTLPGPLVESLVKATGRWALLLRLVNQLVAVQAATGASPVTAAQTILARLRALGPAGADPDVPLDLDDPDRRNTAVRASIQAATELLPAGGGRRFAELGIFAEDEIVPLPLVTLLWRATGDLDEPRARALCMQMAELSLVSLDASVPGGVLALHDVVRDYLRAELAGGLPSVNAALLDGVAATLPSLPSSGTDTGVNMGNGPAWWRITDGYLLDHLVEHLLDAGRVAEAEALTSDLRWVRTRLHQRGPTAPWRDLDRIGTPIAQTLAGDLARAAHLLAPTGEPAHALNAVLGSRLGALARWHDQPCVVGQPALLNRWPPPDLPDPALLRILTGGSDGVRALAFSPDGTSLATACDDEVVRTWDPATGTLLRTLTGHEGYVNAVAFSPDGTSLVSVGADGSARMWEVATGSLTRTAIGEAAGLKTVAFSPDGTRLATVCENGSVSIWDAAGARLRTLPVNRREVRALAFSPGGERLATAGGEGMVHIWDPETAVDLHVLTAGPGAVRAVAFSPDGTRLATAGEDRLVRIWDPTAVDRPPRTLLGHTGYVNAVAFSPDGTRLATAGYDRSVRIWDPHTGRLLHTLGGHVDYVNAVAFSPDGTRLATAGYDRSVRIWNPNARALAGDGNGVRSVAVAQGARLASADDDGAVRIREASSGAPLLTLTSYIAGVRAVVFRPDATRLATVGEDGSVSIWDATSGSLVSSLSDYDRTQAATFSWDGAQLATLEDTGRIRIWDADGEFVQGLRGEWRQDRALAFCPEGTRLAVAGESGLVSVWNTVSRQRVHVLSSHERNVSAVAFSPDGALLATVGEDPLVRLWDSAAGSLRMALSGHERHVNAVSFSPDGRWLATGGDDGSIRVWDPASGTLVTQMRIESHVRCCAWSPDGAAIFVGGRGGLFGFDFRSGVPVP
ncbi:NB-ARC domain-containing protein [Streptomyces sp. B6B3]|uniref:WD40 domain-containing protein n=1 Tax=Streptomyces sp. B6B3 TaxID=3153570 RepID=UPI00325DEF4F